FQERFPISGHWVERARVRQHGEKGTWIEVEVLDLGEDAEEDLFQSLGFDLALEEEASGDLLRQSSDGENYLSNLEFTHLENEGSIQFVAAGRYLMEIHLQGFPVESFQGLEDRDQIFSTLLKAATVP
ncbi:MAG: hypothetical protein AAF191_18275, partial [Verrucomicrobiota bacterium]